eukprot:20179-Heterococcus_DN1.PRE.3
MRRVTELWRGCATSIQQSLLLHYSSDIPAYSTLVSVTEQSHTTMGISLVRQMPDNHRTSAQFIQSGV